MPNDNGESPDHGFHCLHLTWGPFSHAAYHISCGQDQEITKNLQPVVIVPVCIHLYHVTQSLKNRKNLVRTQIEI